MSDPHRPAVVAVGRGAEQALEELAASPLALDCSLVAWRPGMRSERSVALILVDGADEGRLGDVCQVVTACRAARTALLFVAYAPPAGEPRARVRLARLRKLALAWDVCVVEVERGGLAGAACAGMENVVGNGLVGYDVEFVSRLLRGPRVAQLRLYTVDRTVPGEIPAGARRAIADAAPAVMFATMRVPPSILLTEINDIAGALVTAGGEGIQIVLGCPMRDDGSDVVEVVVLLVAEVIEG
jgi:hypothetical protein